MAWQGIQTHDWVLLCLAGGLLVATLLPLSRRKVWWVRGWEFARLQLAVFSVALGAGSLYAFDPSAWWTWVPALVALGCLGNHLFHILPFTPLRQCETRNAVEAPPDRTVRLLIANVRMENRESGKLLQLVEGYRPDIVLALETNSRWERDLVPLEKDFPYISACPLENAYGMHLYSRLPLDDPEIRYLVEDDVPSIRTWVALPCGSRIRLYCVHPAPPSPTENETARERDVELIMIGRDAAACTEPVIVAGDLNDVAWSRTTRRFRRISGLLDPRVGRGLYNTFHAKLPFVRWPLDHVFHCACFRLQRLRRMPKIGSDHFPISIELSLDMDAAHAS